MNPGSSPVSALPLRLPFNLQQGEGRIKKKKRTPFSISLTHKLESDNAVDDFFYKCVDDLRMISAIEVLLQC